MTKSVYCSFFYPQALEEISQVMPPNFIIRNGEKEYKINSFVASNYSQKIFMMILEDASTEEMYVNLPDGNFDQIISVLQGKIIPIADENCVFLFKAACEFLITPLASESMAVVLRSQTIKTIAELLKLGFESSIEIEPMTHKIAKSIVDCLDIVKTYPTALIDLVLQSPFLVFPKDQLLAFLKEKIDFNKDPNSRLIKFLPAEAFQDPEITKSLESPQFNVNVLRYVFLKNRNYKMYNPGENDAK